MTLDAFCALVLTRIPTPAEFLAFVAAQGWRVSVAPDGAGRLHARGDDPVAVALARMLSREPYRTNVLALVTGGVTPAPVKEEEPAAADTCRVCARRVDAEDRDVLRHPNPLCTQGGSREAVDGNGVRHPATARCPWKENA